jgi:hypothetical protein
MNRINPLYILILLVMLLGFFSIKLMHAKVELTNAQKSYEETLVLVDSLTSLKNIYENKKANKASLERILLGTSVDLEEQIKKNSILLQAQAIDYTNINRLVSKLLNSSFEISILEIRKQSDEKAKLAMEIKW